MCKTCKVNGCENKSRAKGYCNKHYQQMLKHGCIIKTMYDPNKIIEHDDYAELVLCDKQGKEIAKALIDLEYIELVKNYKWSLDHGYVTNKKNKIRLHRLIMDAPEDMVVDHINHNKLDNRYDNLRICTSQENSYNQSVRCNNTSGVTGVGWHKGKNKWIARIQINGKLKQLGCYNTKEEAIEARRQAEIDYYGEFTPTRE